MKRWPALAAVALVAVVAALTTSHPAAAQSKDGWITLFDGKSLDHFSPIGDANWRIEDGVLVADKARTSEDYPARRFTSTLSRRF